MEKSLQLFGGDWTEQKLGVLGKYLAAYAKVLSKTGFTTVYIDAFAGTGYREIRDRDDGPPGLFAELAGDAPQQFLEGSAAIALRTRPAFQQYVFIERSPARAAELKELPQQPGSLRVVHGGDANVHLRDWCNDRAAWRSHRAVLFLDPFGMQVDWSTMEAVAKTRAIDTWVLLPLGVAVNRLLLKNLADVPVGWAAGLDRFFGTGSWRNEFYAPAGPSLLSEPGVPVETVKHATIQKIADFYDRRLRGIFAKVAPNPRLLYNSAGSPLYQLHFASGNTRGGEIAVKIAKHILEHI